MQTGLQQGIEQGIQAGIKQGIKSLIEVCEGLNISKDLIQNALVEKFSVTEGEAAEYMRLYW